MYSILKGLLFMHSAEVLHRDIKPANILITFDKQVKICDFGLARSCPGMLTTSILGTKHKTLMAKPGEEQKGDEIKLPALFRGLSAYVVTRWYRAPEIILTQSDYGPPIDVWATGCLFGELLSMMVGNAKSAYERQPLFPGGSSYPFSP